MNPKQVNIKGNALFETLGAEAGGAIYNAEGAEFRFKNGATAVFVDCIAHEDIGGSVYNRYAQCTPFSSDLPGRLDRDRPCLAHPPQVDASPP